MSNKAIVHNHKESVMLKLIVQLHNLLNKQSSKKEQDLKKHYRSVKDLVAESGFGWDNERMMVDVPDSVWDTFAACKKIKDSLQ
uniref:Myb/SANT-like domain-containing protein n=1 Tax=Oryza punctata TaxID=4537 RepID=A0A0E0JQ99_ORYPU